MCTIVEATISAEEFALHDTLHAVPDAEFEIIRLVAHGSNRVMPFLWATGSDQEAIRRALTADSTTKDVEVLAALDSGCLYRMDWMAHIRIMVYVIVEENATILDVYGRNDQWYLRVLFPEHESVSSTYDFCEEYNIGLSIKSVRELDDSIRRGQYSLTQEQYDALISAVDAGFYEVPRGTTLEELSNELNVSHQALSERLRRGHKTLINNALRVGPRSSP